MVSGAGLDVLYSESPELGTSKLINRENVIITPHCGFYSDDAIEACERISVQNITYYMKGEGEVFKIVMESEAVIPEKEAQNKPAGKCRTGIRPAAFFPWCTAFVPKQV